MKYDKLTDLKASIGYTVHEKIGSSGNPKLLIESAARLRVVSGTRRFLASRLRLFFAIRECMRQERYVHAEEGSQA
jgi:hypothetical protein